MLRRAGALALLMAITGGVGAQANGFGEAQGFQFRSPAERQTLILQEQVRLQFRQDVSASALGGQGIGQTGNQTTININGNDNNILLEQNNNGDQSIVEVDGDNNDNVTSTVNNADESITGAADTLMATP